MHTSFSLAVLLSLGCGTEDRLNEQPNERQIVEGRRRRILSDGREKVQAKKKHGRQSSFASEAAARSHCCLAKKPERLKQ